MSWNTSDIPDQSGRIAVVTGANGGLGLETAKALAGAGAHVVMAARNQDKAAAAAEPDGYTLLFGSSGSLGVAPALYPSLDIDPLTFDPRRYGFAELKASRTAGHSHRLRVAMLANGVDIMGAPGGLVSAAHGADDVARTLDAFRTSVRWLKVEGDIA